MTAPDPLRPRLMGNEELEALVLRLRRTVSAMSALWAPAARRVRAGYEDVLAEAEAEVERRRLP